MKEQNTMRPITMYCQKCGVYKKVAQVDFFDMFGSDAPACCKCGGNVWDELPPDYPSMQSKPAEQSLEYFNKYVAGDR
jgi:hypothetical protein